MGSLHSMRKRPIPNFDPDLAARLHTDRGLSDCAHTVTLDKKRRILTRDLSTTLTRHECHRLELDFPDSPYFKVHSFEKNRHRLIIHAGLIADGASIPWFCQWYIHPTEFEETSWAHDALYASLRYWQAQKKISFAQRLDFRALADEILRRHLTSQTPYIPVGKQIVIYHSVRFCGGRATKP